MRRPLLILLTLAAVLVPAQLASAQRVPPVAALAMAYVNLDDPMNPELGTNRRYELIAYGEGATECSVTVAMTFNTDDRHFYGSTSCSAAIQQSGQVSWSQPGLPTGYGPLCSGVLTHCMSRQDAPDAYKNVHYRVTLVAPRGQGWVAPPEQCSGAGTDKLQCVL